MHRLRWLLVVVLAALAMIPSLTAHAQSTPTCGGKAATIYGRSGMIQGTNGPDVIVGSNGPDTIYGNGSNDIICANQGEDVVDGGAGNDTIWGGKDNDTLNGGPGNDMLHGDKGVDDCYGGGGSDKVDTTTCEGWTRVCVYGGFVCAFL